MLPRYHLILPGLTTTHTHCPDHHQDCAVTGLPVLVYTPNCRAIRLLQQSTGRHSAGTDLVGLSADDLQNRGPIIISGSRHIAYSSRHSIYAVVAHYYKDRPVGVSRIIVHRKMMGEKMRFIYPAGQ